MSGFEKLKVTICLLCQMVVGPQFQIFFFLAFRPFLGSLGILMYSALAALAVDVHTNTAYRICYIWLIAILYKKY